MSAERTQFGKARNISVPSPGGWALFLFNLGVEIGQLIFVGSVLLLMTALKRLLPRINLQSGAITVALGAIAVYWTLDRIDIWLQASLAIPHLGA